MEFFVHPPSLADDGVGAASFESLVLRPAAAAVAAPAAGPLAAGPLPPLVLFAHGGPHSAIPSHWARVRPFVAYIRGREVVVQDYEIRIRNLTKFILLVRGPRFLPHFLCCEFSLKF